MIPRFLEKTILKYLKSTNKIIIILGARQVGKTTLLHSLQKKLLKENKKILYLNCDLEEDRSVINTTSKTLLQKLLPPKTYDYLFIDEAQRLDNPGLTLKIIYDQFKHIKVVATGSSSFNLKNKLSDALTGRYLDFTLYPLSFFEILKSSKISPDTPLGENQANTLLEEVLIYGLYPEIYTTPKRDYKIAYLQKIVDSYLFKDVLAFQKVRHPNVLKDLTRALSYQIGSEINENELANRLKIDRKTVVNYLDLLEQTFVIIRIFPFSKNPRREIGKKYKVYFVDMGIRNALIGDFNPVNIRKDLGAIWENFLIVERLKFFANKGKAILPYFWRTYGGAEVDYLENNLLSGQIKGFEIKYKKEKLGKGPKNFEKTYGISVNIVNKENYLNFITSDNA